MNEVRRFFLHDKSYKVSKCCLHVSRSHGLRARRFYIRYNTLARRTYLIFLFLFFIREALGEDRLVDTAADSRTPKV